MKKILLFSIFIILMLTVVGYFYVTRFFLPVQLHDIIQKQSKQLLNRNMTFGDIAVNLSQGVVVHDIKVFDETQNDELFVGVETLEIHVNLLSFLRDRQILIDQITLTNPDIYIEQTNSGWNFDDIISDIQTKQTKTTNNKKKASVPIQLRRLDMINAKLHVQPFDQNSPPLLIHPLTVETTLDRKKTIQANVDLRFNQKHRIESIINFDPITSETKIKLGLENFQLTPLKPYLPKMVPDDIFVSIPTSHLDIQYTPKQLDLKGSIDITELSGSWQKHQFQALIKGQNMDITIKNNHLQVAGTFDKLNLDYSDPDQNTINLNSAWDIKHLVWQSGEMGLTGSSPNLILKGTWQKQTSFDLNGEIKAIETTFAQRQLQLITSANLNINDLRHQTQQFSGTLNASDLKIEHDANQLAIQADIKTQVSKLNFQQNLHLHGQLDIQHIDYKQSTDQTTLSVKNLSGTHLDINTVKESFKGDLTASDLRLTRKEHNWHFSAEQLSALAQPLTSNSNLLAKGDFRFSDVSGTYSQSKINLDTDLRANNFHTEYQSYQAMGDSLKGSLNMTYKPNTDQPFSYQGQFSFQNIQAQGLPIVDQIDALTGQLSFSTDLLQTDRLDFKVFDTDASLSGLVRNIDNPLLDIKFDIMQFDFERLDAVTQALNIELPFQLKGQTSLAGHFKGNTDHPITKSLSQLDVTMSNVRFDHSALIEPITNINGQIYLENEDLQIKNLTGDFQESPVKISANIKGFEKPTGDLHAVVADLSIRTQLQSAAKQLRLENCRIDFLQSNWSGLATFNFENDMSPQMDVKGQAFLNLADMESLPIELPPAIFSINPKGQITLEHNLSGPIMNWQKWRIEANARADSLRIKDIAITQFTAMIEPTLPYHNAYITGQTFNGSFDTRTQIDLNEPHWPSASKIFIENIDLAAIVEYFKLKKADVKGLGQFQTTLNGPLKNPQQWQGVGQATIKEGSIVTKGFLTQLGQLLGLDDFRQITFTDASSQFSIKDGRLLTPQTIVKSRKVNLVVEGWIDLNQNISFDITPQLNTQSNTTDALTDLLMSNAVSVKVSGLLSKPKYTPTFKPLNLLKDTLGETGDAIFGGIKLLDELLK